MCDVTGVLCIPATHPPLHYTVIAASSINKAVAYSFCGRFTPRRQPVAWELHFTRNSTTNIAHVVLVAATALEEEKLSQEDADEGKNSFIAFELGIQCFSEMTFSDFVFDQAEASWDLIAMQSTCRTSVFAGPKAFNNLKGSGRQRDRTIVSPHDEVDVSDHNPNHHHSDLVYGNHLSTEQTPPAHHRGIFQRLLKAKSNISRGAAGE
ncbi:hypothetical protein GBF38_017583 [Nibea albiflora]|uniref:Uncharacterized protein n=1 Tax=Nibea albiflora TaxID=240163 RepID=A0ACB7F569_NIBAL|nr:hypothetical protein GBF38_017583 [Nibea albiflora]